MPKFAWRTNDVGAAVGIEKKLHYLADMKIHPIAGTIGFRSRKAAQIAAYFATQSNDEIEKLKLVKLLYLAERESMQERGRPIIFDEFYSLKHGPICSNALNAINGDLDAAIWNEYLSKDGTVKVKRSRKAAPDKFDELSRSDHVILKSVWEKFGWMTAAQLRNWTHNHCPEYVEVLEGRLPITYADIFKALGFENPDEMAERIREYRSIETATAS